MLFNKIKTFFYLKKRRNNNNKNSSVEIYGTDEHGNFYSINYRKKNSNVIKEPVLTESLITNVDVIFKTVVIETGLNY